MIHFLHHARGFVKMVWYDNVRFKNRTVTAFLVAHKKCSNKHSTIVKHIYCVSAVDKSSESHSPVLRKVTQCSVMQVALSSQQKQSLRHYFKMLMNAFKIKDRLQPESLQLTRQYPRQV